MARQRGEEPTLPIQPEETPEQLELRTKQPYEYERQRLSKELLTDDEIKQQFEIFKELFYPLIASMLGDIATISARLGGDLRDCMWQMKHDQLPFDKYKKRWELFCLQYLEDCKKGDKQITVISNMKFSEEQRKGLEKVLEMFSKLK